ncbi:MAG: AMP-binding protein [Planctomycetes bacterium]|nr:AMP-binding protein [Planctomycetota bacterium]
MPQTDEIRLDPAPLADYEAARAGFRLETVAADLGADTNALNLGMLATERHVLQGRGSEHALVWWPLSGSAVRVTYAELTEWSGRVANMLLAQGVQRGDRIVLLLPVIPELFAGILGALRAGTAVCVLGGGHSVDYVRNTFVRLQPRAFVTVAALRGLASALKAEVSSLQTAFLVSRSKGPLSGLAAGELSWSERFEAASPTLAPPVADASHRALIHFTDEGVSGSVLSHRMALSLFYTARSVLEMRPGEAALSVAMPGEHTFVTYSALAPFLAGATSVVLENPAHFQRWGDIAAEMQPRAWFSGFKAIDVLLRVDPNLGALLRKCRNIACTWPYDRHFVSMTAHSYGSPIHAAWAEPEFGTLLSSELRGCSMRPGSVGRPLPGVELRILNGQGQTVDREVFGHVAVRMGPGAPFVEYWDDPALTLDHLREEWFVTSRVGKIDTDGYVWLES